METKLFSSASFHFDIIDRFQKLIVSEINKIEARRLKLSIFSQALSIFGYMYCFYQVVHAATDFKIQLGTMMFLIYGLQQMRSSSNAFLNNIANQHEQVRYLEDVFKLLDTKRLYEIPAHPVRMKFIAAPKIEFRGVWFQYEGQKDFALRDFNLTIMPGDRISICGENGCGKSTFVTLLSGIYRPTKGVILINGIDSRRIHPDDLSDGISVLLQRNSVYDLVTRESIGIGDISLEPDDGRMDEAVQYANTHEVIAKLKDGYDTQLGEQFGGIDLSGGQEKRFAIARRMFRKRLVAIFDEPEKELDSESRAKFFVQLRELDPSVTAIYISHNIATLRLAKRIIVMSEGQVVEEGSHAELITRPESLYTKAFEKETRALLDQVETLRSSFTTV